VERTAAETREKIGHPVIDSDGHVLEFMPAAHPYLKKALGEALFARYYGGDSPLKVAMSSPTLEERRRSRVPQAGWWGTPVKNVRDVATSLSPRLLHARMDELGFDFAVLFPTSGFNSAGVSDEPLRRGLCAGFNEFFAQAYGPFADRLTVAGIIPMNTPQEAIEELEHCHEIGLKVVGIPHGVLRPIAQVDPARPSPWMFPGQSHWWDFFGLDSEYDYDGVWKKFVELGFVVNVHGGLGAPPTSHYTSISSWMANHIGSFAAMHYPTCKSLYLGGVTRRLPEVPFAFLESGVGWACTLLAETVEHWEKRNLQNVQALYDPVLLDTDTLVAYMVQYSPELLEGVDDAAAALAGSTLRGVPPEEKDEWRAMAIKAKGDLGELFVHNFYFGCEADDRTASFAFSKANAFGSKLKAMFSSDISHFDVPQFDHVLPEAYGLLEKGVFSAEDFRRFTFENAVELYTRVNPRFFEGTVIEKSTKELTG
jgi:predicted TIM-barrel fold metal-dependent hydrolase